MAAEPEIPPVFRTALDEPAPPPPVDPEPEDDDHGGHHIHIVHPALVVFSDGAVHTASWASSLLLGWIWLATGITSWTIARALFDYLPLMAIYSVLALGMVIGWIVLGAIGEVERQHLARWWARRRAPKASVQP